MRLFNQVTIQTPESVELDFTLAGIGSRAFALVIDYIILAFTLLAIIILWGFLSIQLTTIEALATVDADTLNLWVSAILGLLCFAVYVGYFVFFETLWHGQTPGKRFTKIRVIRDDAQPARLFQATLRSLLRPIDDIFFLGFFCIALSNREKRIGDWLAGTLVVQTTPPLLSKGVTLNASANSFVAYLIKEGNLANLLPDDFAIVREYLERRSFMTTKARSEVSLNLARQLKAVIHLDTLPSAMTAEQFLEAIYLAYQQHFGT